MLRNNFKHEMKQSWTFENNYAESDFNLKLAKNLSQQKLKIPISTLPLESKRVPKQKDPLKIKLKEEVKFIHLAKYSKDISPDKKNNLVIKNIVFRNQLSQAISEQKMRKNALEETRMLQRERRFNKKEIQKKTLGVVNNFPGDLLKRYVRTQQKKVLEDNKKFKRLKQKQHKEEDQYPEPKIPKIKSDQNILKRPSLSKIPNLIDQRQILTEPKIKSKKSLVMLLTSSFSFDELQQSQRTKVTNASPIEYIQI